MICVKRFTARRGLPLRFLSDNAKTFKSATKTLKAICDHPDTKNYLTMNGVEWSFNLEKAPWWGGLFERMIKSTKRCLRKVVGRARFSYDEMHTVIVEIEAIVNGRPLSYVHPDKLICTQFEFFDDHSMQFYTSSIWIKLYNEREVAFCHILTMYSSPASAVFLCSATGSSQDL